MADYRRIRNLVITGVVVLIGVPVLLALIAGVACYALLYFPNRSTAVRHTIVSAGQQREYLLYVPTSYDRAKATPLVISLHPAMSWPSSQMNISRWNDVADRNGFIVVYPAGTGTGPKAWVMSGRRHPSTMPDVRFISELIDSLEAAYHIDPARIYADGLSNGGGMAFALSCTLSSRIAAIGAVSAAQSLPWSWCADTTPVPMIAFHGTADPFVPYEGAGTSWLNPEPFPNVRRWAAQWARRNRCAPKVIESTVTRGVVRTVYTGCARNASVVLYTIRGGGHQWPGGKRLPEFLVGAYSPGLDATSRMWAFYSEHRLETR